MLLYACDVSTLIFDSGFTLYVVTLIKYFSLLLHADLHTSWSLCIGRHSILVRLLKYISLKFLYACWSMKLHTSWNFKQLSSFPEPVVFPNIYTLSRTVCTVRLLLGCIIQLSRRKFCSQISLFREKIDLPLIFTPFDKIMLWNQIVLYFFMLFQYLLT